VDPAQLARRQKLFRTNRNPKQNLDVCDILFNIFVRVQLVNVKLRELGAQAFRKPWRRDPQLKAMVGKN